MDGEIVRTQERGRERGKTSISTLCLSDTKEKGIENSKNHARHKNIIQKHKKIIKSVDKV